MIGCIYGCWNSIEYLTRCGSDFRSFQRNFEDAEQQSKEKMSDWRRLRSSTDDNMDPTFVSHRSPSSRVSANRDGLPQPGYPTQVFPHHSPAAQLPGTAGSKPNGRVAPAIGYIYLYIYIYKYNIYIYIYMSIYIYIYYIYI